MKVIDRSESQYFKEFNPFFDTRARFGKEPDTIILYVLKTPSGKWSKYWATLRFNSERNVSEAYKMEEIEKYYNQLINRTFKSEIKKGYTIAEVILYSGHIKDKEYSRYSKNAHKREEIERE